MSPSARITTAVLLILAGAVCYAQKLLPLELRVFPKQASLSVDGTPVALKNGTLPDKLQLAAGDHTLLVSAADYQQREFAVSVPAMKVLEGKLERARSGLVKIGEAVTGTWPKCAEYTPDGRFVICALLRGRGADVFDAVTLEKVTTLSPEDKYAKRWGFVEVAFIPGRDEIWVSQMEAGSMIHVFRLSDWTYLASFPSGGTYPKYILVSADEKTVYVSNWGSNNVSVIDPEKRKATALIKVGGIPRGLVLTRGGEYLYVCIYDRQRLVKIDVAKKTVVKTLDFGTGAARHVVLHPTRDILYVSDMGKNTVFVVDLQTDKKAAEYKVGDKPNTIKLSPDGAYLFVSNRGPNNPVNYELKGPEFGKVLCLDAETGSRVDWTWGGNQPTGLCVSTDGGTVMFTDFQDGVLEAYSFSPVNIP